MSLRLPYNCFQAAIIQTTNYFNLNRIRFVSKKLEPEWKERERIRLSGTDRKRATGQGHPYFGTFFDLALFLVVYTRTRCSNVLLGLLFGLTEPIAPWTGEDKKQGWIANLKGRRNHPLTKKQKKETRKLSKIRIGAEQAIRRVKMFRRVGETAVFRAKGKLDSVLNAAVNLANYKQLLRYPAIA